MNIKHVNMVVVSQKTVTAAYISDEQVLFQVKGDLQYNKKRIYVCR